MAVSCQRELTIGEEDRPLVYGSVNVSLGQADPTDADGAATKSLISVETEDFVDAYLFAFNASTKKILTYQDGSPMAIYTKSKTFDWTLAIGTKMDIWVVANPGTGNAWKTTLQSAVTNASLTESDLSGDKLIFKCASSSALKALETSGAHLPMSAMENGITLTKPTQSLSIKVKRLFAKYNIYLDTSLLEAEGYTVKSTYLASSKSNTEVPFFYQTNGVLGGYKQASVSKLATIDRNTEEDLVTLENGQKVTLYFLENCQGTKTGAEKWSTVYRDLGASALELCSYMEVGVKVTRTSESGKEPVDESYAWRIYLGKSDMKSDFNVERNLFKTIKLTLPDPIIVWPDDGFKFTNTNSLSVAPGETITVPFETSISSQSDIQYEIYLNGIKNTTAFSSIEPKTFKANTTKKTGFAYEGTVALTASKSVNVGTTYQLRGGNNDFTLADNVNIYADNEIELSMYAGEEKGLSFTYNKAANPDADIVVDESVSYVGFLLLAGEYKDIQTEEELHNWLNNTPLASGVVGDFNWPNLKQYKSSLGPLATEGLLNSNFQSKKLYLYAKDPGKYTLVICPSTSDGGPTGNEMEWKYINLEIKKPTLDFASVPKFKLTGEYLTLTYTLLDDNGEQLQYNSDLAYDIKIHPSMAHFSPNSVLSGQFNEVNISGATNRVAFTPTSQSTFDYWCDYTLNKSTEQHPVSMEYYLYLSDSEGNNRVKTAYHELEFIYPFKDYVAETVINRDGDKGDELDLSKVMSDDYGNTVAYINNRFAPQLAYVNDGGYYQKQSGFSRIECSSTGSYTPDDIDILGVIKRSDPSEHFEFGDIDYLQKIGVEKRSGTSALSVNYQRYVPAKCYPQIKIKNNGLVSTKSYDWFSFYQGAQYKFYLELKNPSSGVFNVNLCGEWWDNSLLYCYPGNGYIDLKGNVPYADRPFASFTSGLNQFAFSGVNQFKTTYPQGSYNTNFGTLENISTNGIFTNQYPLPTYNVNGVEISPGEYYVFDDYGVNHGWPRLIKLMPYGNNANIWKGYTPVGVFTTSSYNVEFYPDSNWQPINADESYYFAASPLLLIPIFGIMFYLAGDDRLCAFYSGIYSMKISTDRNDSQVKNITWDGNSPNATVDGVSVPIEDIIESIDYQVYDKDFNVIEQESCKITCAPYEQFIWNDRIDSNGRDNFGPASWGDLEEQMRNGDPLYDAQGNVFPDTTIPFIGWNLGDKKRVPYSITLKDEYGKYLLKDSHGNAVMDQTGARYERIPINAKLVAPAASFGRDVPNYYRPFSKKNK